MKTPIFQNSIALTAFFQICNFRNVNFTDAVVSGYVFKSAKGLTFEQIKSTWNYKTGNMGEIVLPEDIQKEFGKEQFFASKSFKEKRLLAEENPVISPEHADYELFFPYKYVEDWDLSGMDLRHSVVVFASVNGTNFSNAQIEGVNFKGALCAIKESYETKERFGKDQLESTASYQNRQLVGICFTQLCDLKDVGFSHCDLSGRGFVTDLSNANFTNAIITGCNFERSEGLTFEQVKSTWNYKTGNMRRIALLKDIQEQLDKENITP